MRRVHILFIVASWTSAHVQVGASGVLFLVVFHFSSRGKGDSLLYGHNWVCGRVALQWSYIAVEL